MTIAEVEARLKAAGIGPAEIVGYIAYLDQRTGGTVLAPFGTLRLQQAVTESMAEPDPAEPG